ncbi:MAG: uroporphyrinogen-III synthase [Polyangiales bacterium]
MIVVGEVVALRGALQWWTPAPLAGRRVVVTRASEQAEGLADVLARDGAEVIELAAIRFEAPSDPAPLRAAIESLSARPPEVVAFTSANGVRFFFDALRASGRDARALAGAAVVAVGPATSNALRRNGIDADLVPDRHVGEALADAVISWLGERASGARALLPRAEVARGELVAALRARGVIVDDVPTYRTVSAASEQREELRRTLGAGVDAVTFMSPSAVNSVLDALGGEVALLGGATIASVGPVTSAALRARGITPAVEAASHTADGLVHALRAHLHEQRDP